MKLHAVNRSTLFLFRCLLYFGGSAILNSDTSPILIIRFLQLTGLSFIFYNFFFLVKKQNSRLTSFCVCFFVILGVFIMIRGNYLTVMSVLNKVYDRMGLMLYLKPLIYFILSENVLKKMFSLFFLMSLLFVVLILLSYTAVKKIRNFLLFFRKTEKPAPAYWCLILDVCWHPLPDILWFPSPFPAKAPAPDRKICLNVCSCLR